MVYPSGLLSGSVPGVSEWVEVPVVSPRGLCEGSGSTIRLSSRGEAGTVSLWKMSDDLGVVMVTRSDCEGRPEAATAALLSREDMGGHVRAQALDSPLWSPPPAQVPLRSHTSQGDTFSFPSRRTQAADGTETHSQRIYFWFLSSGRSVGGWVESAPRPSASSPCGFGGTGKKWMAPSTSWSFGY